MWTPDLAMLFTGSTATIDLDFAQAQLLGPVVDIELKVSTAKVKIGIGSDQQVRTDGRTMESRKILCHRQVRCADGSDPDKPSTYMGP